MSRFRKLSQTIWHCQYHLLWTPKYRYRILTGELGQDVDSCIRAFSERSGSEVVELNVQIDHVHLLVFVPPKISISSFMGTIKGRTAIRVFNRFRKLLIRQINIPIISLLCYSLMHGKDRYTKTETRGATRAPKPSHSPA